MARYFETLSDKDLAELKRRSQGKTVNDITYCSYDLEYIMSLSEEDRCRFNTMKENNLVHTRFLSYLISRKDLISRTPADQVSFFVDDLNYEIIKRFTKLY